ncbi:hypothetical protein NX722_19205 [Endozoicomonas gorgoniicola]|uniref:Lipoprotein n=1 Tax=Endozoicomonas gorgoniicola TaxID=1234144 RepID=A0ABT3MZA0_9GAMM|nr:hypothetical protein [Endozoicomonas gorgoniicola]MCW7554704.1 hypothetical protein [Endozoicomonas gorgoniicola]
MKSALKLLILPLLLFISACGSLSKNGTEEVYYQLETNLLIDGRPLQQQSIELPGYTTRKLYFHDDVMNHTYKVEYAVMPGEEAQTVFIDTMISRTVRSVGILAPDNEEAGFTFKEPSPEIELQVKARPITRR